MSKCHSGAGGSRDRTHVLWLTCHGGHSEQVSGVGWGPGQELCRGPCSAGLLALTEEAWRNGPSKAETIHTRVCWRLQMVQPYFKVKSVNFNPSCCLFRLYTPLWDFPLRLPNFQNGATQMASAASGGARAKTHQEVLFDELRAELSIVLGLFILFCFLKITTSTCHHISILYSIFSIFSINSLFIITYTIYIYNYILLYFFQFWYLTSQQCHKASHFSVTDKLQICPFFGSFSDNGIESYAECNILSVEKSIPQCFISGINKLRAWTNPVLQTRTSEERQRKTMNVQSWREAGKRYLTELLIIYCQFPA